MMSASIASAATATVPPTSAPAPNNNALEEAQKTAASSSQGQQNLRNTQILEASLQVSIQSGNDGLALLYRTAVDEINAVLEPELGPEAVQAAIGQDNSPEATAGRIISLSTALFDKFAARYPDKDLAEVAQDFVNVIRGGFEQGYREAENILSGLGVLSGTSVVADGIAKTFELVQKGYDDWLSSKLASLRGDATPESAAAPAA